MVYPDSMRFSQGLRRAFSSLLIVTACNRYVEAQPSLLSQGSEIDEHARLMPHSLARHGFTQSSILETFTKAQVAVKLRNLPVALSIDVVSSTHASAFVYQRYNIRLSEALLETLQSKEQLAFAISHEMAHIALGHKSDAGEQEERAADSFAVSLLTELGMDSCASVSTLEALLRREPTYREPLATRAHYLRTILLGYCPTNPTHLLAMRDSPMTRPLH